MNTIIRCLTSRGSGIRIPQLPLVKIRHLSEMVSAFFVFGKALGINGGSGISLKSCGGDVFQGNFCVYFFKAVAFFVFKLMLSIATPPLGKLFCMTPRIVGNGLLITA